jgi:hypothetical protein
LFFEQDLTLWLRLASNSQSLCHSLSRTGITSMNHCLVLHCFVFGLVLFLCSTGDGTKGIMNARQVLYCRAKP